MWQIGIFKCSENKQILSNSALHSSGSTPFLEHAERSHPKEPKFAEWIHQKAVDAAQQAQERAEEERSLRMFALVGFSFVSWYS